jgi:hypothetical protein
MKAEDKKLQPIRTHKIKFTAIAVKWFDKVNGNTYHSVRIIRHKDGKVLYCPFTYGYGDSYRHTAFAAMDKAKWLPLAYRGRDENGRKYYWRYERENDYPIIWTVRDGLKRECVANGQE